MDGALSPSHFAAVITYLGYSSCVNYKARTKIGHGDLVEATVLYFSLLGTEPIEQAG
jgi:hypothetical protein